MLLTSAVTLSSVLEDIGTMLTSVVGWVGQVATLVTNNPIIFIPTCMGIGMIAVGVFKRVTGLNL